MYENQNKHYAFNVFPERYVLNVIFHFVVYTVEEIRICFSSGMFFLLRRHRKSS